MFSRVFFIMLARAERIAGTLLRNVDASRIEVVVKEIFDADL